MTATATATKRITIATVKSFIRRNRAALFVREQSCFDAMQDMVTNSYRNEFAPAAPRQNQIYCDGWDSLPPKYINVSEDHPTTLGLVGVWFCGGDLCEKFENDDFTGYKVYNCCGTWFVAVAK